jgi:predicted dienelactone hydrolase
MRIIEVSLFVLVLVSVIWTFACSTKNKGKQILLLSLSSVIFLSHALMEGLRIQMACIYLALPVLWLVVLFHNKPLTKTKRRALFILFLLCLLGTLLALWLFPVNTMPKPTGPYVIGTNSYELIETGNKERYGTNHQIDRHIKFQVWYPADTKKGGKPTKWLLEGKKAASGIPVMYKLPSFLLDHTALIRSHSYEGLGLSNKEQVYPLILISHGWTGFSALHSDLGEMLASHGYIVVSINHTYGAAVSVFENGEVVYVDPKALPDRSSVKDFDSYSHALVNTFAQDDRFVLDFMETDTFFAGRIDTEKVGAMGHSTGGGGVVSLALTDPRIKAVLGLDAWVEPIDQTLLEKGLHIPSAFLRSEQWETGPNNKFLQQLFAHTTIEPGIYQIQGGNHQDFSMLYLYLPVSRILGVTGTLDPLVNAEIQQSFVLTFFDQELKQEPRDFQNWFKAHSAVTKVTEFK